MTTYYTGPGGNDGNSGLTWALRKLTLNGVEDIPVVAGDFCWVAPGVYREMLIVDVSGGAGTEIVYQGDVTGENTDGVGGVCRVTGSDNDQTFNRNFCIYLNNKSYRVFRGFRTDMANNNGVEMANGTTNVTVEDCLILENDDHGLRSAGSGQAAVAVHRCAFILNGQRHIDFEHSSTVDNTGHLIENCLFIGQGTWSGSIHDDRVGGITVRNCTFLGAYQGIRIGTALTIGQTITVENCIFDCCNTALSAQAIGEIVEDFNTIFNCGTARANTNVGANSVAYPSLISMPLLNAGVNQISGYKFPWWFGELSQWSQVAAITGNAEPTEDLRGLVRPVTASKNSWGAVQFHDMERDAGTVYEGIASLRLADAGRYQAFFPIDAVTVTVTVQVYREANYAGNAPQMIIKRPGMADDITADAGGAGSWNELTTTVTLTGTTDFMVVELVSRNTAAAGNYATYFDNLEVT